MKLFKWIKSLFKKKHDIITNTICGFHVYNYKYDPVERLVNCANNKVKLVYDVYEIAYCKRCNKIFHKRKIRAGLTTEQVEKEFGIKTYTLDYGKDK